MLKRSAGILNVPCEHEGAFEIARRSRGNARESPNRLLRRVRDFAQVIGTGTIDRKKCRHLRFAHSRLMSLGLDKRRPQNAQKHYPETTAGGPVGPGHAGRDHRRRKQSPWKMFMSRISCRSAFLSRTPRGRCVTLQAYRHLNLEPADGQQNAVMQSFSPPLSYKKVRCFIWVDILETDRRSRCSETRNLMHCWHSRSARQRHTHLRRSLHTAARAKAADRQGTPRVSSDMLEKTRSSRGICSVGADVELLGVYPDAGGRFPHHQAQGRCGYCHFRKPQLL